MPDLAERTLEAAGIGGWELHVATGALRWTSVTFRIHDLDVSEQPPLDDAIAFYIPSARPVIRAAIAAAISDATPWDLELPVVTAHGRNIWVRSRGQAIRAGGKTTKLYGTLEDTTARRALAEREARLSVVAAQMTNVVITMDLEGRIDWVNDAFTRMTGYTAAEALGRTPDELLDGPLTDRETVDHMIACKRQGRSYQLEILNYGKDGRAHWMSVHGSPMQDAAGRLTGYISVESDITERRALAEREARLSLVARQMSNHVLMIDREGRTEWVNDAFTRRMGWTLDEMRGRWPGEFLEGPQTDPVRARYIAECVRSGIAFETELHNYCKDGRVRVMAISGTPLTDERGAVTGFISVETDITERRAAEDAARREAAERERAEALLRDVLDTLPSGVTAYDANERLVVSNAAYREIVPIAAQFLAPGRSFEEVLRLAAEAGQYADAPTDPVARDAWVAEHVGYFRARIARTVALADGRTMQVRERQSVSGLLVSVRTDMTDLHQAEANARREAAERKRAEALLRDVIDTLPVAVIAYDAEERFVLSNKAHAEMVPVAASAAALGSNLADIIRRAVEDGQFADAPSDPIKREAYLSEMLRHLREANGTPHTMRLSDGRITEVRERRSEAGNLVIVRGDITELYHAEANARREAAERERAEVLLRDVLDTLPVAVIAYDAEERFALANKAHAELRPILSRFATPGRKLDEIVRLALEHGQFPMAGETPEQRERWMENLLARIRGANGTPRTVQTPDGRVTLDRERRSDAGNLVLVRSDITDLYHAEEKARREAAERERTEILLRDVLDTLPVGVIAYDAQERYVLSNKAHAELGPVVARFTQPGRKLEEIVRLSVEHGQFPEAPTATDAREQWIAGLLNTLRRATGEARMVVMPGGRATLDRERRSDAGNLVVVRSDITELHAAEAKALRTEVLLRDVLDSLPVAVIAYDEHERVILSNRAHAEMAPISGRFTVPGAALEDIMRQAAEHGQFADVPEDPRARAKWLAAVMAKIREWSGEPRILRMADGRVNQIRERRSENGHLVVVRTDITELDEAQEKVRREAAERARTEALLRDVLDALPSAVIAYDSDERLILQNRANSAFAPIAAPFNVVGARLAEVFGAAARAGQYADAPTDADAREAWIAERLAWLRNPDGPRTMRMADGRWMQVNATRSASGNLVFVQTDTTDVQRAQALLRDVLDTLTSAVSAYDDQERLILANRAYTELLPITGPFARPGVRLEDAIRRGAAHGQYADAPADPAAFEPWLAACLENIRTGGAHTMRLADGRFLRMGARRSDSGTLVNVMSDVTDLTRAQDLLRDVLDTLPTGVIAYDRDDRVMLTNRAYHDMFPIAASFATPGKPMIEVFRQAALNGQYAHAPRDPQDVEEWLGTIVPGMSAGRETIIPTADGRVMQSWARRSATGTLVSVRTDVTELTRVQALLRDVIDTVPSAIIAFDPDDRVILTNRAFTELYPVTSRFAIPGQPMDQMFRLAANAGQYADKPAAPEEFEAWIAGALDVLRSGVVRTVPLTDGRFIQMRGRRSPNGTLVSVRTETTETVRAQALLQDVLEALPSAVTAYDEQERLILTNRAYAEMFPIAARFAQLGDRIEDTLRIAAEHGQFPDAGTTPEEREAWLAKRLASHRNPGPPRTVRLPDGRFAQARESRSKSGVTVCIRSDATDLVRAETSMRILAERDALTGLANRSSFLAELDRAIAQRGTDAQAGGALLLLDIDFFKQINDTLGHDIGDALLTEIGNRLRQHLRGSDVPARLGGDEFGVVMPGLRDPPTLSSRIDDIHTALSAPVELAGRHLPIGVSVGVTTFPADGTEASKLLKNADLALYEAKRNGRGRWASFRPEQAAALDNHNRLADALREALARGQLKVALQPKRRLRDGRHDGFEALARWHDGTRWVPPVEFIPVAEQSGLIGPLGRAIMDAALERSRDLRELGLDPGRVAVNVTAPQLLDTHFKDETLEALRRNGLHAADLELEVTETVLLGRAAERIDTVLREFSELGITLALDDFGTGYASLAHLSRLPIDRLKIDRSFVIGIGEGGAGAVIARTVVSLARSLEMESVAEGIETLEQFAFLEAAGCDAGQGYLFSKPLLTLEEAATYLRGQTKAKGRDKRPAARIVQH